jgi:DnaK suppressor protein
MADKKTKKKNAKKIVGKSKKAVGAKTALRPKRKTVAKSSKALQRAASKKQKTAVKKTALKPKSKVSRKVRLKRKPAPRRTEEERKAALRRSLVLKRESIVREAKEEISKYIKGETRQLVDTALDDGDWSVVDLSEDISLKQLSTHRENLQKIDEALRKVDEGTYGICEDCGEEISDKRLKILPFAIYCTDCQENRERIEEIVRRERTVG